MDADRSRDGERRHATVLFADLSGFTALSEQRDPEDVATVVSGCLDALAGAVHDHGGHVDKYIGDCVMAVFGVPHAAENAATNAINAAIDMRKRLENLNGAASGDARLTLHVGINTGLVVSGDVGGAVKREFTVMGDAVNVASRLKDTAGSMAIYVGAETYRETSHEFAFRKLPPLVVKGKAEPLTAYEVLSERERVYRLLPSERMVSSALVGRDRDLGELRTAMRGVMEGRGAIVSVVGDAGIGKSRLLVEAADLPEFKQATVLQGRSLSMGSSLRFHPFVDLLRQWAAVAEDDDEPAAAARVEAAVAQVLPDVAADVFPFIATLMGLRLGGAHAQRVAGIEPEGMEALIRKSMRELVQAIAASRPLALLFEDLHWADQSSVQLLESLLRLVGESRVLFVHVFRPDHDTTRRLLRTSRERFGEQHREIMLEPLAALDCDLLVRNLLRSDDLPHAVSARVAQRAEGNPFYIEEVIRSWIDKGVVESAGGRLRITEQVHSVVIPGTVQEVIMARVDRLPDDTRRLLQTASVIGRSIYHRVLADVIGPDVDFDADVAYLKERQILFERRSRRTAAVRRQTLAEELEFVFKHALVQETVYQSILQRTRKELHRRVAQSIERLFADRLADFFGMLAYHYSQAAELEKAEEYLFKAGDEAARSAASSEALHHFREASRLYLLIHGDAGDPKKRVLLEKSIAMALHNTGNLRESIEHFDRALSHLGDVVPRSRASTLAEFVDSTLPRRTSTRWRPSCCSSSAGSWKRWRPSTSTTPPVMRSR